MTNPSSSHRSSTISCPDLELRAWRMDGLMHAARIIFFLTLPLLLVRSFIVVSTNAAGIGLFVYLGLVVLLGIVAFAPQLDVLPRTVLLIGTIYSAATLWLVVDGMVDSGRLCFLLVIVLTALLLDTQTSTLVWSGIVLTIAAIYAGMTLAVIPPSIALIAQLDTSLMLATDWFTQIMLSGAGGWLIIWNINRFQQRLQTAAGIITDLQRRNSDLEQQIQERSTTLQERQMLLQAVLDYAPIVIVVKDRQGHYIMVNQRAATNLNCEPGDLVGVSEYAMFPDAYLDTLCAADHQVWETGQAIETENTIPLPDGFHTYLCVRFPLFDEHGHISAVGAIGTDITERKQAEEALRASEAQQRAVWESATDALMLSDAKGLVLAANPAYFRLYGYTPEQIIGQPLTRVFPEACRPQALAGYYHLFFHGEAGTRTETVQRADGVKLTVEIHIDFVLQENQRVAMLSVIHDITKRKQAEEAMRTSETRYRMISELTSDYAFALRVEEHGMLVNEWVTDAFSQITGLSQTATNDPAAMEAILHPDDRERVRAYQREALAGQLMGGLEFRIQRGNEIRWLRNVVKPIWDTQQQRVVRIYGAVQDITERKQIEAELHWQRQFLRQVIDSHPAIICARDHNGRFTLVNQTLADVYGTSVEALLGKTDTDMRLDAAEVVQIRQQDEQVLATGTDMIIPERCITDAHGRTRYFSLVKRALSLADQPANQVLIVATDITARKLAEVQLRYANERLRQGNELLQQRNRDMMLINQLGALLQGCISVDDAYQVLTISAEKLFTGQSGALYIQRDDTTLFDAVAWWGDMPPAEETLEQHTCRALQDQQLVQCSQATEQLCGHLAQSEAISVVCAPLIVESQILGVLHLRSNRVAEYAVSLRWMQIAETVAQQVSLALHTLMLREQLQRQVTLDPLTGLYNRRYLDETLPRELQRAKRHSQSVGVIMLDIDHFKRFNDTYGHDAGDALLRAVGAFLQTHTRSEDIACRYGGEEFILVLPDASLTATWQRAEELRAGIQSLTVQHQLQLLAGVTASLGVAIFPDYGDTVDMLIRAADQALYQAKRNGRNQVVAARGTHFNQEDDTSEQKL